MRQDATSAEIAYDHTDLAGWPFPFRATQSFVLTPDGLDLTMAITNLHDAPAPAALGAHPFFPRSPAATLRFAARSVWLNGTDQQTPIQRIAVPPEWNHADGRPVGSADLDNCFAGWDGVTQIDYPDLGYRITTAADSIFRHLVVYVPPGQPFFAVEPVSNMNDGLNHMQDGTDHGIATLAPGETLTGRIAWRVADLA